MILAVLTVSGQIQDIHRSKYFSLHHLAPHSSPTNFVGVGTVISCRGTRARYSTGHTPCGPQIYVFNFFIQGLEKQLSHPAKLSESIFFRFQIEKKCAARRTQQDQLIQFSLLLMDQSEPTQKYNKMLQKMLCLFPQCVEIETGFSN